MYIPSQTIILKSNDNYLKVMFEKLNDNYFRCYYSLKEINGIFEPFVYKKSEFNILDLLNYVKKDFINKYQKIDEVSVFNLGIFTIEDLMNTFNINIGCHLDYDVNIDIILTDKKGVGKTNFLKSGINLEFKNALKEQHYLIKIQTIK